jgi:hypothetical protein
MRSRANIVSILLVVTVPVVCNSQDTAGSASVSHEIESCKVEGCMGAGLSMEPMVSAMLQVQSLPQRGVIDNADVGKESPYDEEETIQDHLEKHFDENAAQDEQAAPRKESGSEPAPSKHDRLHDVDEVPVKKPGPSGRKSRKTPGGIDQAPFNESRKFDTDEHEPRVGKQNMVPHNDESRKYTKNGFESKVDMRGKIPSGILYEQGRSGMVEKRHKAARRLKGIDEAPFNESRKYSLSAKGSRLSTATRRRKATRRRQGIDEPPFSESRKQAMLQHGSRFSTATRRRKGIDEPPFN